MGLAAIGVTVLRFVLPTTSVLKYLPWLYAALFLTSIWVGLATQFALYLTVRRAKLAELDRISGTLTRPARVGTHAWDEINGQLSSYSVVASSTMLPYGSSTVLQYGTAVLGAVAGYLLQFAHT
jgi:hypothetical protein